MTFDAGTSAAPSGLDEARLELRQAGYCVLCDAIVERGSEGCVNGHPAAAVTGRLQLDEGQQLPRLPKFNLAAFLMPPIWGPAHGQWAGAFFLPIWLFADNVVVSAIGGGTAQRVAAVVVVSVTLAFQTLFARKGNGLAYRRVIDASHVDEFLGRERVWALVAIPVALALLGWGIWFDLARL